MTSRRNRRRRHRRHKLWTQLRSLHRRRDQWLRDTKRGRKALARKFALAS